MTEAKDVWFLLLPAQQDFCVKAAYDRPLFTAVQALAVETKRDILTFGTFTQNNVIVSVKTLLSELGDTRHHSIHVTCQDNSTTSKQLTPKSTPSSKGLQTDIRAIYEEAKRCGIKLLDVEDDLDNPIHDTSNSRPARFGPERTGFNKHVQRQFFDSAINQKKRNKRRWTPEIEMTVVDLVPSTDTGVIQWIGRGLLQLPALLEARSVSLVVVK